MRSVAAASCMLPLSPWGRGREAMTYGRGLQVARVLQPRWRGRKSSGRAGEGRLCCAGSEGPLIRPFGPPSPPRGEGSLRRARRATPRAPSRTWPSWRGRKSCGRAGQEGLAHYLGRPAPRRCSVSQTRAHGRLTREENWVMTYCVALRLDRGLVFAADTRTSAGNDNVAMFRKLHYWRKPGERVVVLASAGNLAVTQSVISLLNEQLVEELSPAAESLFT